MIPNLLKQELPEDYDLRGYIELFLRPNSGNNQPSTSTILANAEHRSTYYDKDLKAIGELASGISLAEGKGLISVDTLAGWQARP